MIRRNILIDSDEQSTGQKQGQTTNIKNPVNYKNIEKKERNRRISPPRLFVKTGSVGYLIIVLELLGVILGVIAGAVYVFIQLQSWWFIISCVVLLIALLWAITKLPKLVKNFLKIWYFRIHSMLFMLLLGSLGYWYTKDIGLNDLGGVIFFVLLTAVPSILIHLPYLRKENILSL